MPKELIFEAYDKQQEFIDAVFSAKYNFLTYGGAVGGGKTFVVLAILLVLCKMYPGSKWVVIRKSVPTLKSTTLESFSKLLPLSFLSKHNQEDRIFHFKNGSQIRFMAEDYAKDKDHDRFKGLEVNGIVFEQIEEIQESTLNISFTRIGRWKLKKQPPAFILATVNPTQTWVKQRIYQAWLNSKLPKKWFYLPALISDNPVLYNDKEHMAQYDNLDPLVYARFIDGDWDAFAVDKPFMYCFDETKHVSKEAVFKERETVYLSFDFNVDPATCIVWQEGFKNGKGWIHYIDEIFLKDSNIFEVCEMLKRPDRYPNSHFIVTGDASGKARHHNQKGNINSYTIIKKELGLKDAQFKIPSSNPPINESRTLCNAMFSKHPEILYHPDKCKNLINDLKSTQVDDEGKIDTKGNKHRGHLLDADRYSKNTFHYNFIKKGF